MWIKDEPYDCCVTNKVINGKQCNVVWHVDDLKISHVCPDVVTNIIEKLNEEFGNEAPITGTRERIHESFGMMLDCTNSRNVIVTITTYLQINLNDFPNDMAPPAASYLFDIHLKGEDMLDGKETVFFHPNVAKLLFLLKRA